MIVISNALPRKVAEGIRQAFLTAQYSRYEQRKPDYYAGTEEGFPAANEWYTCKYERSQSLEDQPVFVETGKWLSPILQRFGQHAEIRAYKMGPGDHFRLHDDASNGKGFIYYLSKGWKWDWGGLLMAHNGREVIPVLPTFNQLVILEYKSPHFVTEVAACAKEPRYAIVGFLKEADGSPAPRP